MKRILLIHWNAAEGAERAKTLSEGEYEVSLFTGGPPATLRNVGVDAFIIDLTRLPSQGTAVAISLRQQKTNRLCPLVFAGGAPDKVEKARQVLPDASYTSWEEIIPVLQTVLQNPVIDPLVPGTFDPYSSSTLVKKLGIGKKNRVLLSNTPERFEAALNELPEEAVLTRDLGSKAEVVLLFSKNLAELELNFPGAAAALALKGKLWLLWPKRTAKIETDLSHDTIQQYGLNAGFMDYKICSVDETWSGLCFTRKK